MSVKAKCFVVLMLWNAVTISARPEPPAMYQNGTIGYTGRHLQSPPFEFNPLGGPAHDGCNTAGLSCCYDPSWWLSVQPAPVVTCLAGRFKNGVPAANDVLETCYNPPAATPCGEICIPGQPSSCKYTEYPGDAVTSRYNQYPANCENNTYYGQTYTVYDRSNLKSGNNEVVWADFVPNHGQPDSTGNCNVPASDPSTTLTSTGSYSKTSGWTIGGDISAAIPSALVSTLVKDITSTVGLTASYSKTVTVGTSTATGVSAPPNHHATVTVGSLVHHSWGNWVVDGDYFDGCTSIKIDGIASDTVVSTSNPDWPTDSGSEVKPCGYPLMSGKT